MARAPNFSSSGSFRDSILITPVVFIRAPSMVVLTIFTLSNSLAIDDASTTASFQSPLNSCCRSSIDRVLLTIRRAARFQPVHHIDQRNQARIKHNHYIRFHHTAERTRMGCSADIRLNASTGAPRLSGPKLGKAWANFPSCMAASAVNSADVTAPWPPRPCQRISIVSPCFISNYLKYKVGFDTPLEGLEPSHTASEADALSPELQGHIT